MNEDELAVAPRTAKGRYGVGDPNDFARKCCDILRLAEEISGATYSALCFTTPDGQFFRFVHGPSFVAEVAEFDWFGKRDESLCSVRVFSAVTLIVDNSGETVGKLYVLNKSPRLLTDRQLDFLRILTSRVAVDIEHHHLARCARAAEVAKRESDAKFKAVIDSSSVACAVLEQGIFTYLNPQFESTFGYSLTDVPTLEQWWVAAYPDAEYRSSIQSDTARLVAKAKKDGMPFEELESRVRCKDGSERIVLGTARLLGDSGSNSYVVSFYDITERKQYDRENKRLLAEAQEKADHDPLTGLLNHRAFYNRLDEEAERYKRDGTNFAIIMLDLDNFKFFNDVYGHAVGDKVLKMVSEKLLEDSRSYDKVARFGGDEFALLMPGVDGASAPEIEYRLRSSLAGLFYKVNEQVAAIPVSISLGAAIYCDPSADSHDVLRVADERLRLAKTGGNAEACAQDVRADAGSRVRGFSMLDALVTAVDNKDRYTRRHSEDVMEYTLMIYRELEMDEGEQRTAAVAALLHDVGKIGVPDAILRKPGDLTGEELEIVKQHPVMGAVMVSAVPGLEDIIDAVRYHHERWDGNGYPSAFKGEETPFIARVMAVADAFSAMTTDRPYRKAMDRAKALSILLDGSGIQWDPHCVSAFLRAWTNQNSLQDAA